MFTRHVSRQLAAQIDGQLNQPRAQRVERHTSKCARCRAEREQVRFGMEILDRLPPVEAPDAIWLSIEAALREQRTHKNPAARRWRWAFAATAVSVLLGVAYWSVTHRPTTRSDVVRMDGRPTVIRAGQWIETDSRSSATVKVGEIGSVEVAPGTRLRVVTARPGEHRLALARGEIRAKISAPPRLFFVETLSGTAVDLGCEYTLNTDETGFGLLRVTRGWVSFQWQGIESLVPAGASCRIRPNVGPGIPYFDDASQNMQQAIENFGFEKAGNGPLDVILAEARVRDTLTLWHLLSRVDAADRARVYDRIASLTPVPAGVSREEALKLDAETLRRWKEELAWTW
jgi:predicted anti-sigma-YlaC factor YlaD